MSTLALPSLVLLAIANLAFIARQIDVRLTIPRRCFTNLICLLPKPVGGERPIVLQSCFHAESIRELRPGRASGTPRSEATAPCSSPSARDSYKKLASFWVNPRCLYAGRSEVRFLHVAAVDLQVHLGLRVPRWAGAFAKPPAEPTREDQAIAPTTGPSCPRAHSSLAESSGGAGPSWSKGNGDSAAAAKSAGNARPSGIAKQSATTEPETRTRFR